jgi:acyl carrier protein
MESDVAEVFRNVFGMDDLGDTAVLSVEDNPDWDSLLHITLVVSLEQEFGIKFTMEEIPKMINFGTVVEMVFEKVEHGKD